ncbi:hypothetical protein MKEN_00717000 [Mycena kentingensis (nom. inval.)]|nr:hypothetical protein MKEN_00717000 [Mycena kentingensis (nom. inval.)]
MSTPAENHDEKSSFNDKASAGGSPSASKVLDSMPSLPDASSRSRVMRKLDIRLLPFVSLLFMLAILDRVNIGNARVAGILADAKLVGLQFNTLAAVFYVPYAFLEVPSNVILRLTRPSIWIPSIMVAWGLVMALMSICKTYHTLLIARIFLGVTEAGLFPGISYFLSMWYAKRYLASRVALFYSSATIAGAFGGILAYGIGKLNNKHGLHSWQWIFLIEGVITIGVALLSYLYMPDYPETAKWLTEEERSQVTAMLKEDSQGSSNKFNTKFIWQAIGDWRTYVQAGIYLGFTVPINAIGLFTPAIVQQIGGFSPSETQLMTVPPFVCGCLMTLTCGFLSDRYKMRGAFLIGLAFLAFIGYMILYFVQKPGPAYFGAILAAMGVQPTIPIIIAWSSSIAGGDLRRAVVLAVVIGIGNLGGVCASYIYTKPPFHVRHGTILGCLAFSIMLSAFCMWDYSRVNKQREAYCKENGIDESRREEFTEMGSESPLFRYSI